MSPDLRLWRGNGESGGPIERKMLTGTQESTDDNNDSFSSIVHRKAKPIVIGGVYTIFSIAVLVDGEHWHVVSGDGQGKIQRWHIQDGKEVGVAMNAGSAVLNVAVSQDGNVIVSGTVTGRVTVWNTESHSKVTDFEAHHKWVRAVDVSPDATKIVTGSEDNTACVWSLLTGKRLLGPWKHNNNVVAAKFSPDGRLIATATFNCATDSDSVRVYDSQNGSLLANFPVYIYSLWNQSLVWASDSKHLFALSQDGYIHHVDVFAKTTLSKWQIHSNDSPTCITLAGNDTFIAASAGSSVSFWDTTSREQIGFIECTHTIRSMALSSNYDLVTRGDYGVTLRALSGALPTYYLSTVGVPIF